MKRFLISLALGMGLAGSLLFVGGLCMVAPGEVAVVRRFGRLVEPAWGPGLHWRFPLGIDRVDRVRSDAVRQFAIGQSGPAAVDQEPSSGEVLTGDLNLVHIQATVQFRVANPVDYLLHMDEVEPVLIRTAEASLCRAMSRRGIDAVLRSDRRRIAEEARGDMQADADRLSLGVTLLGVSLIDARPPVEVAPDFAAAQSAESLRDRRINDATTEAAVKLTAATARARAIQESAHADADRMILGDRADAQRFLALMTEAQRSRGLTIRRLYIESIQSILDRVKRKLITPAGDAPELTIIGLSGEVAPRNPPASRPRDVSR